jgi:uroporphyrinogen-III synthase
MKTILYLGLEVPESLSLIHRVIHYPVIQIVPKDQETLKQSLHHLENYSHFVFTSKTAVALFFDLIADRNTLISKTFLAVGKSTAKALAQYGIKAEVPKEETAEGLIELMETSTYTSPYFFWPHSALSRSTLLDYFNAKSFNYVDCIFYDTISYQPDFMPNFQEIDAIYFTSPSCIEGYLKIFGTFPTDKALIPIGPITRRTLVKLVPFLQNENMSKNYTS